MPSPTACCSPPRAALCARLAAPPPDVACHARAVPTVLAHARPYRRPTAAERVALERVDIFSPVIDTEYRLVRRHLPGLAARHVRWNYGTVEDDYTLPGATSLTSGRNILAGNSATPTNNHIELFERIRRCGDLGDRLIVTPLSYGDVRYRDCVIKVGRELFGDAFVPLVDFMPKESYIELLGSCGHVMMNHVRQQALGNLFISGLMGARLHLSRANPLYTWLGSLGVPVSDIERADLAPLPERDRGSPGEHVAQGVRPRAAARPHASPGRRGTHATALKRRRSRRHGAARQRRRITRAGLPTTVVCGATSRITTAPMPTIAPSPMVSGRPPGTPGRIVAPAPM